MFDRTNRPWPSWRQFCSWEIFFCISCLRFWRIISKSSSSRYWSFTKKLRFLCVRIMCIPCCEWATFTAPSIVMDQIDLSPISSNCCIFWSSKRSSANAAANIPSPTFSARRWSIATMDVCNYIYNCLNDFKILDTSLLSFQIHCKFIRKISFWYHLKFNWITLLSVFTYKIDKIFEMRHIQSYMNVTILNKTITWNKFVCERKNQTMIKESLNNHDWSK